MLGSPSGNGGFAPSGSGGHHSPRAAVVATLRPVVVVTPVRQRWSTCVQQRWLPPPSCSVVNTYPTVVVPPVRQRCLLPVQQQWPPPVRKWWLPGPTDSFMNQFLWGHRAPQCWESSKPVIGPGGGALCWEVAVALLGTGAVWAQGGVDKAAAKAAGLGSQAAATHPCNFSAFFDKDLWK